MTGWLEGIGEKQASSRGRERETADKDEGDDGGSEPDSLC